MIVISFCGFASGQDKARFEIRSESCKQNQCFVLAFVEGGNYDEANMQKVARELARRYRKKRVVSLRVFDERHSRLGIPQHDWDVAVHWHGNEARWQQTDPRSRFKPRQILEFRVSVPARTAWHEQAAVFTIWRPGSPPLPKDELIQFYGFRKRDDVWACTASTGPEGAYDRTAEAVRDGS